MEFSRRNKLKLSKNHVRVRKSSVSSELFSFESVKEIPHIRLVVLEGDIGITGLLCECFLPCTRRGKTHIEGLYFRIKVGTFYLLGVQYPWCHCFLCLYAAVEKITIRFG